MAPSVKYMTRERYDYVVKWLESSKECIRHSLGVINSSCEMHDISEVFNFNDTTVVIEDNKSKSNEDFHEDLSVLCETISEDEESEKSFTSVDLSNYYDKRLKCSLRNTTDEYLNQLKCASEYPNPGRKFCTIVDLLDVNEEKTTKVTVSIPVLNKYKNVCGKYKFVLLWGVALFIGTLVISMPVLLRALRY